mmetsp:Transcript_9785/g.23070  ORF Transcript_9785/g.23070 Transcript_9785/m.23070 type:complete len:281 (-) Transcript_9785:811-1653(-)
MALGGTALSIWSRRLWMVAVGVTDTVWQDVASWRPSSSTTTTLLSPPSVDEEGDTLLVSAPILPLPLLLPLSFSAAIYDTLRLSSMGVTNALSSADGCLYTARRSTMERARCVITTSATMGHSPSPAAPVPVPVGPPLEANVVRKWARFEWLQSVSCSSANAGAGASLPPLLPPLPPGPCPPVAIDTVLAKTDAPASEGTDSSARAVGSGVGRVGAEGGAAWRNHATRTPLTSKVANSCAVTIEPSTSKSSSAPLMWLWVFTIKAASSLTASRAAERRSK